LEVPAIEAFLAGTETDPQQREVIVFLCPDTDDYPSPYSSPRERSNRRDSRSPFTIRGIFPYLFFERIPEVPPFDKGG